MKIQITMTVTDEADVNVNHPSGLTEQAFDGVCQRLAVYGIIDDITQVNEPVDLSGKAAAGTRNRNADRNEA